MRFSDCLIVSRNDKSQGLPTLAPIEFETSTIIYRMLQTKNRWVDRYQLRTSALFAILDTLASHPLYWYPNALLLSLPHSEFWIARALQYALDCDVIDGRWAEGEQYQITQKGLKVRDKWRGDYGI